MTEQNDHLDDAMEQVRAQTRPRPRLMSDSLLCETETEPLELVRTEERFTEFEFKGDRLHCAGYTPAEVAEFLRLYREHLRLLGELSREFESAARSLGVNL